MIQTKSGMELKKKLLDGINKLNDSVASTLGPGGRNVIIQGDDGNIRITKDGVSVATSFTKLEDPLEDIGAQLIRKVSEKSADTAGDGTTTSTLLAAVMVNEGIRVINQGSNAVEVKKGIDKAVKAVVAELKSMSVDISSEQQIVQVATVSANNDTEVGNLIATALEKVGTDGIVAIEDSKSDETTLEVVEGMMLDRGFKSPYFVTDNMLRQAILEKPVIFLYDGKLTASNQILPVLQAAQQADASPLLIVAEDIDHEALAILVVNKANGVIKVCAVKAPEFAERRTNILEDMAILTGGTVVSTTKGHNLSKMKPSEIVPLLGKARMVNVSSKDTTIIDGKGEIDAIEKRLMEIKSQIEVAKSNFEIEKLQERLSKLTGGVAIINIGGKSEVELKEKKDRADDALHATKAALEQGIVPGGGMALINCVEAVNAMEYDNDDQRMGAKIVEKALYSPFKTILLNAGVEDYHAILSKINTGKVTSSKPGWEGYNVKSGIYVNMLDEGILDPTKVTKTAIENAASVAGTILTTQSVVYSVTEEKKEDIDYSQFMG